MPVKPASTFCEVLEANKQGIKVPDFQRNYAWNEEKWDELWSDLEQLSRDEDLYLGALILIRNNESPQSQVVDGQQRLVTLSVLCAACRNILKSWLYGYIQTDVVANETSRDLAQKLYVSFSNMLTRPQATDEPEGRYVYLNDQEDSLYVEKVFSQASCDLGFIGRSEKRFVKCLEFYLGKLKKEYMSRADGLDRMRLLRNKISDRIKMTVVEVSAEEEAFDAFESLNSKGESLTPADLLKNRLLKAAEDDTERKEINEIWASMDSYMSSSRFGFVDFIWFYWTAFHGDVTKKTLYKAMKNELGKSVAAMTLARRLQKYAEVFATWTDKNRTFPPQPEDAQEGALVELNSLGYRSCYPTLMLVHEKDPELVGLVAQMYVRFLFRVISVSRQRVHEAEEAFGEVAAYVKSDAFQSDDASVRLDTISTIIAGHDVSDEGFLKSLKSDSFQDNRLAKYILAKIHYYNGAGETDIRASVQLEHILPQSPDGWIEFAVRDDDGREFTIGDDALTWKRLVSRSIYSLGNMLLIHKTKNQQIGNQLIDVKLTAYRGSDLRDTRDVADMVERAGGRWTRQMIESRLDNLVLARAVAIWPRAT